ncbi:hypothetical protein JAAARDRAFT_144744 [Jaapia argillacea MUCL 33604]|uniref:Uncharacterized protein n=1 Tax=Jaapia argillacea MUCL 33604 TaxID=933084 RepID=A0A067QAZ0_9AGAM|nr:hypothetical protein JAAARDRAFT_144744 [Jaapia argillacea MUCL 33604]
MPPKAQPKNLLILLKTHKLTIFLSATQSSTIGALKSQALSALQSHSQLQLQSPNPHQQDIPDISSEADFELCKPTKERGKVTGYEVIDGKKEVKGTLVNWDTLFVRFRDPETGDLLEVDVTQPSLLDDEEDQAVRATPAAPVEATSVDKGKRKAYPE